MAKIEYVKNLYPVFTKPKRIKIVVGGRGSTKTTGIADYVVTRLQEGQLWCCAREFQNSIEESVHRTLLDEIERLELDGFKPETKTGIEHISGGRAFYRGLARNIASLKSTLSGINGLWIEEGETLSNNTLRVLTASVRLSAAETQRYLAGEAVNMPEIIITMNRGASAGAVAQKWLARAEPELERCGYYEDDLIMVVQVNHTDMPQSWFEASGLEDERRDDYEKMSRAEYDHKWLGHYYDTVENALIKTEWFDACVDAHKIERLKNVFKPLGARIAAHDPFDDGNDAGGYALRHGSIIESVRSKETGEIDQVCDWATGLALQDNADWFVWDGDGMGTGLKRQIQTAFDGTRTQYEIFKGSLSGVGQDNAKLVYMPDKSRKGTPNKTYSETFKNNRAQYYVALKDRIYNTFRCVERGEYVDPENMISFDSDGIENITVLRSQLCRIPLKYNSNGVIQLLSKQEMLLQGILSPNEADSVMMTMVTPQAPQINEAPIEIPTLRRFA